jgi:hypothetical protein
LKDRRTVTFEASVEYLREKLQKQKRASDIRAYINSLRDRYDMEIDEEELEALAGIDSTESTTESDQALVTWRGGRFTVGDYMDLVSAGRATHPAKVSRTVLQGVVDHQAGQHLMLAEARHLGLDRRADVRRQTDGRRRELFAKWLFERESKRRARIDTTDANVRRYYEENIDLYTGKEGEVSDLADVARRIRSYLVRHQENAAMDEFIAELRERFADKIHINEAVLDRSLADEIPPSETTE